MNNIITDYHYKLSAIKQTIKDNQNQVSEDSQKLENKLNVIYEAKKFSEQKLSKIERFIRDSLAYMLRYGDIMDKLIDSRVNYLLRKKINNKGKLEKILDNKDISVESLQSKNDWEAKECKIIFLFLF